MYVKYNIDNVIDLILPSLRSHMSHVALVICLVLYEITMVSNLAKYTNVHCCYLD